MSAVLRAAPNLHGGEREALALALELSADVVLMDEAAGRRAAGLMGVPVTGTLGVLLAKARGLLSEVRPCLDRLESEVRFHLAPALRAEVLRLAGEAP